MAKPISNSNIETILSPELTERVAATSRQIVQNLSNPDAEEIAPDPEAGITGKLKRFSGTIAAPMQINHGQREMELSAARQIALNKALERRQINKMGSGDYSDKISYVECTQPMCQGPGIWLVGNPFGILTADNWFASYKPLGAYWGPKDQPHCQCCSTNSWLQPLRVDFISVGTPNNYRHVSLIPNPRFVRTILRSEYEKLLSPS